MNDEAENPMHPDFARWYHAVEIDYDQERRQARWDAVCELRDKADFALVEALIRLAFKTRQLPTSGSLQLMRDVITEQDETFPAQGNDREMQILAGASLAVIMEDEGDVACCAALAVTTTCIAGGRRADLPMDLNGLAENALIRLANGNRNRPDIATYAEGKMSKVDFAKVVTKVREQPNAEGFAQAFTLLEESMRSVLGFSAKRQAEAVNAIHEFIQIQDEELQMLWWLIGQRSWDYDCVFEAVPSDAQPLVLGSELADATKVLPGPPSVKALLSRAGIKEKKKITIPVAINSAKQEWLREKIGENNPSPVTTPLHDACRRQLETGNGDAWIAGWVATTGISESLTVPLLTLGTLFYRERLLITFN
ncbi:MAG: GTPase-associated system all-helical protein GASH [Limnobacter sp.]|uniref:GTPase-associated system all-helical protein GASH n=1 Tax=Limnobacter sp. TaxID=2003368 RepID=UPI001DF818BA|nr:hypothetical protein [Alcaligenaceae bacterium]